MRILIRYAVLMAWLTLTGAAQPTGNVITRVLQIRFGNESGTAFVIDYEDRQYYVTADHVLAGSGTTGEVEVRGQGEVEWRKVGGTILHGRNKCVDVAVVVPKEKKVMGGDAIPYPYNYALGQEVYFLGFPYGLYTTFAGRQGLGAALIKHAYVSAVVSCAALIPNAPQDEQFILLDGMNNPGFSGGPVVAPDMFSPFTNIRAQKLIGVVNGFRKEDNPLHVNGKVVPNASTEANTGIIAAVPFDRVVELIKDYVSRQK